MEVTSLLIAGCAFVVSFCALLIAYFQLREARTTTGGRGLTLHFRPLDSQELSEQEFHRINALITSSEKRLIPFLVTVEVVGPAEFFEVMPHSWGEEGSWDIAAGGPPIKRLTCDSGPVDTVALLQADLLEGIKLGVVWRQAWQRGLETGAIRASLDGTLEEWVYYSRIRRIFNRRSIAGKWRERPQEMPDFGPVSQPWHHPRWKPKKS